MNKIAFFLLIISFLAFQTASSNCPQIGQFGAHFSEEFLYWVGNEKGLGFTNHSANVLTTDDFTHNSVINPTFKWDFGFRLGGGYTQSNCQWSYQTYWTYLRSKAETQKSVNSGSPDFLGIYPIWSMGPDTLAGDYVSSASSSWRLFMNMIDLIAQYNSSCFFNRLILMPFLGGRGVSLSQKLTAQYSGGTFFNGVDHNVLHSSYLGAGPRLGLNADCYLAYGLSLFGRAAAAPIFGRFHIKQRETYLGNLRFSRSTVKHRLLLGADFAAGLRWK